MSVVFESGYTLPGADQPLTHARIAHSGQWASPTITASTTDADYFTKGPDNSLTYERWKPTALPADWEADFGGAYSADYCVVGAHDLGTQGCNVKVQSWNGATWDDVIGTTAISDDSPIMFIFEPRTTPTQYRLRVTSGSGNPTIGVIKFGQALQMPRAIFGGHTPLKFSRRTTLRQTLSETGEFLGQTKQRSALMTDFAWNNITAAWIRTNWAAVQTALETEPFFIAWRPSEYSEVGFCRAQGVPVPTQTGVANMMQVAISAIGFADS